MDKNKINLVFHYGIQNGVKYQYLLLLRYCFKVRNVCIVTILFHTYILYKIMQYVNTLALFLSDAAVVWMICPYNWLSTHYICSWCCWLRVAAGGMASARAGWSITGSTRMSTRPCLRSRWPTITSFEEKLILSTHGVLFNQGRRDCALVVYVHSSDDLGFFYLFSSVYSSVSIKADGFAVI